MRDIIHEKQIVYRYDAFIGKNVIIRPGTGDFSSGTLIASVVVVVGYSRGEYGLVLYIILYRQR